MGELSIRLHDERGADEVLTFRSYHPVRAGEQVYLEGFGSFQVVEVNWNLRDAGESARVSSQDAWGYFLSDEREDDEEGDEEAPR